MSTIDPRDVALLVIAKEPRPGRAKTRLSPPLSPEQAAALARAAIADTLDAVAAARVRRRVVVLDGDPGSWVPEGFDVIRQRGGGLDERLAAAFEDAGAPALLVGMDTPQIDAAALEAACTALAGEGVGAVIGPAADGGYWAIGLRRADRALFAGVPMSAVDTGARQLERIEAAGLVCIELEELRDFDTIDDARAVAASAPGTGFAAALARIDGEGVAAR
jgi:rSAM/selenodomain-associated transferase 1